MIKVIEKQILECKKEIQEVINSETELSEKVEKLVEIKGVGILTIATVIAETQGFEHFKSVKQLVSYTGLDVVQRESGTSIKGKTRISKKGNKYIRRALYMPSIVACRYNENLRLT